METGQRPPTRFPPAPVRPWEDSGSAVPTTTPCAHLFCQPNPPPNAERLAGRAHSDWTGAEPSSRKKQPRGFRRLYPRPWVCFPPGALLAPRCGAARRAPHVCVPRGPARADTTSSPAADPSRAAAPAPRSLPAAAPKLPGARVSAECLRAPSSRRDG